MVDKKSNGGRKPAAPEAVGLLPAPDECPSEPLNGLANPWRRSGPDQRARRGRLGRLGRPGPPSSHSDALGQSKLEGPIRGDPFAPWRVGAAPSARCRPARTLLQLSPLVPSCISAAPRPATPEWRRRAVQSLCPRGTVCEGSVPLLIVTGFGPYAKSNIHT